MGTATEKYWKKREEESAFQPNFRRSTKSKEEVTQDSSQKRRNLNFPQPFFLTFSCSNFLKKQAENWRLLAFELSPSLFLIGIASP